MVNYRVLLSRAERAGLEDHGYLLGTREVVRVRYISDFADLAQLEKCCVEGRRARAQCRPAITRADGRQIDNSYRLSTIAFGGQSLAYR